MTVSGNKQSDSAAKSMGQECKTCEDTNRITLPTEAVEGDTRWREREKRSRRRRRSSEGEEAVKKERVFTAHSLRHECLPYFRSHCPATSILFSPVFFTRFHFPASSLSFSSLRRDTTTSKALSLSKTSRLNCLAWVLYQHSFIRKLTTLSSKLSYS